MGNTKSRRAEIQTKSGTIPRAINNGPTEPKIPGMEPKEISPPTSPQDHPPETGNTKENTDSPPRTSPQDHTETANTKENTDSPPRTSPQDHTETANTPSSDSASPQTTKVTAEGQPATTPIMDGEGTPPAKNQPTSQKGAVIISLEEDNGMKILQNLTKSFINDCHLISPSTITKGEDWRPDVEKSPIVMVYSSSSKSSIEKMKSYMEDGISRKGHQAVIVIADIQDSEEKVRSELGISRFPECELHVFTKTEWLLQDPRLQVMAGKIKTIRDSLPGGSQKIQIQERNNLRASQNSKNGATFFIQETTQEKSHWLEPVLRTNDKVDFTVTEISKMKKLLSRVKEIGPISCILHFSKETFQRMAKKENSGATAIDRKILHQLGNKVQRVVVVVDDVDDDGSEDGLRALYNKTQLSRSAPLVVFRREEKQEEFLAYFSSSKDAEEAAREKWSKLQKSIETKVKAPDTEETEDIRNFTTVGIFSRSSNIDYSWMDKMLTSPDLQLPVSGVRSFCISNNQTLQIFDELNLCTFGILYHTKNRGRVNVTDVTDSLYDKELEDMHLLLGRNNVIVVIDDLADNSLKEKNRILESQPSIKKYAYNLLLVTEKEKKDKPRLLERLREALMFKDEEQAVTTGVVTPPPETTGVVTPPAVTTSVVTPPPGTNGVVTPPPETSGVVTQPAVTTSVVTPPPETTGVVTPPAVTTGVVTPPAVMTGVVTQLAVTTSVVTPPPETTGVVTPPPEMTGVVTPPAETTGVVTPPPETTGVVTPPPETTGVVTPPAETTGVVTQPAVTTSVVTPPPGTTCVVTPPAVTTSVVTPPAVTTSVVTPPAVTTVVVIPPPETTGVVTPPPGTNGKNHTNKNVSKSKEKVSNRDFEKKLKSERDSKKDPESKQDPQKEMKSKRDSKKEPGSKKDSEKESDIHQDSGNGQTYSCQL